jgi:hypothetical protein
VRWSSIEIVKMLLMLAVVVTINALAWDNAADGADRIDWNTGADFQRALADPCDILWAGNPLRQAMRSLSLARKVAILVARRVDPSKKLVVSLSGVALESALRTIAEQRGLSVTQHGAVVYIGPPAAVENLQPIAVSLDRDIRLLPAAKRKKYQHIRTMAWDDFATPRELIERLGEESGLKIVGLDRVPHDLWAAADLPPMTLTDRLALVAVQFDLALRVADRGAGIELVPLSAETRRPADQGAAAVRAAPRSTTNVKPDSPASIEQTRIDRLVVQDKPLGPVLKQLAGRLGLQLKIDEQAIRAAGISLDQLVSVRAEKATVDELLRQLLKSTGLTFHRRDRVVEIVPAK